MMDDVPYLLRGITQIATSSSVLISSSKYLNNPKLRDWVATELLRRNGADVPTPSGAYRLNAIMKEIQDYAEVDALFAAERKKWPALDRWFQERFISTYTREDLKQYPPGSVGGIYYRRLTDNNYQVDIVQRIEPKGDFEYWAYRCVQNHDMEHILGGGGFDSIGELVPGFMRLTYVYKYFSPELANELAVKQFFLSLRFISRTALHYPACWPATWDAIERGRRAVADSDPFFLARYEDIFHLTPEAARPRLGIRNVRQVDTSQISRVWDDAA
jgi:ubiquinone biosynthesis protein COQ4